MFTYRLHLPDGSDVGEATYPDRVKIGEELFFGGGRRFRVLDVVIFGDESDSCLIDRRSPGSARHGRWSRIGPCLIK